MLKAIIEAQVKGGYVHWELLKEWPIPRDAIYWKPSPVECWERYHILEILLDPSGLASAYPWRCCEDCRGQCPESEVHPFSEMYWEHVAHEILESWLSKNAGDALGAIRTAYELLPSPLSDANH